MGHSLRVEDACVSLAVGAFLMQMMHWGLWKSWPRCSDTSNTFDAISPDRSAWLFVVSMTSQLFVVGLCIAEDKMTLTENEENEMFKREEKGRTLSFVLLSSDKRFVKTNEHKSL